MICVTRLLALGMLVVASSGSATGSTNLSAWIYPGASGRMLYKPDYLGNRILDASGVGYGGGVVPLPAANTVPIKVTVSPVAGDNTANIQSAISQVAALPLVGGFRGAVLLSAGTYPCSNTIAIGSSGIVLRGVGSGTNGTGTVLQATAARQYTLVEISGSGSATTVSGTTHTITNRYVPTGARSFFVDSTSGLAVGDNVFVQRVATSNWIHDLGMDLLGPPPDVPWTPGGYNIDMERTITRIEGNCVFVDAPITCAIDAGYANGTIRKFTWSSRIANVGIEHIYAKSDYFASSTNENHGWTFVQFDKTVNGWARDIVSQFFGYSCVNINSGDKFITVADCQCLDPISIITGGRRYAFAINDAQYCLVKNCYTRQDRHQFVTQSLTIGPSVFVDGLSDNAHAEAGPHQRWATGILWDRIVVHGGNMDIQNAGNYGTGHGWEGATCVAWNHTANGFIVQNPPGAKNWLIGSVGPIQNGTAYVGPHDPGIYDSSGSSGSNVFPNSLYFAQLQDRLAAPNLQTRDYWLGDIDGFTNSLPGGEVVTVEAGWRAAVQAAAGSQSLDGFDVIANNHWVPFTFNLSLGPTDRIVAATLSLSMLTSGSAAGDVLYLDSLTNGYSFSSLGWMPIATGPKGTNATVRVLDLGSQLSLLTNGQLNLAVQGDIGTDSAMLELQVAPANNAGQLQLMPTADATVRGGSFAANNFGTATTLTTKNDATADNTRQAYLRWDLSSITQTVFQARVSLTPVSVGTNAIEQGVSVAANDAWTETGITWNNQPGGTERFANWIPATNVAVSFDVTPQVLDAMASDQQLSLVLFSVRNVGSAGNVDYAAREYSDPNSRPQLLLSLLGAPPVISAITNRTVPVNGTTGPIPFSIGDADSPAGGLLLAGHSSNQAMVPDANIAFGGSGSNRTVTVTPAGNQSGAATIAISVSDPSGLTASAVFLLTVSSHTPSTIVWNGPGAGANYWSSSADWSPTLVPEALDDVKFYDAGASGLAVSNLNNVVDTSFGGNIASLQYANTNGNHTTSIAPGNSLTISGGNGLVAGTESDNGSAHTVFATITGPTGALALNNPSANLIVRQGSANNGSQRATLDLSGLGTFSATLNQLLVGFASPVNRATGTLFLGRTNTVTATGSPGICAGDNSSNNGGQQFIYLGQRNSIFVDSLTIARRKATATLKFNPAFSSSAAVFRASDGAGRVSAWNIADHSGESTSSSSCLATNDFSGGTVDALVDTLVIGKSQQTTGANTTGVLTFSAGTFDVNTLQIGFQTQSGAVSAGVGRVNLNGTGAVLVVNTTLELGHTSGGAGATNTLGVLNINGGTLMADTIVAGPGSGSNSIGVNNGVFALSGTAGTPAFPIAIVSFSNAVIQLSPFAGTANLVATSLLTAGTANQIKISSLPNLTSFPAQFALIKYSGSIGGAGNNFTLSALPVGTYCGAYLSNNLANGSVDLVVTNCLVPDLFLTWQGASSRNWDTETANWKNNLATGLTYAEGTSVVFNDTATGVTDVILADTFFPASVTVSNNTRTYSFVGPGDLSGGMALTKQGSGTFILANVGSNDFSGGVTITAGTLQIANNAALGTTNGGTVIATGATLDLNHNNIALEPVTVSGAGVGSNGALVDNSGNPAFLSPQSLACVTLSGDTTFGGTGRWDLRSANTTLTNAFLSTTGHPYNLTKTGTNQVSLVAVAMDPALADVNVLTGVLSVEKVISSLGNPTNTLTVSSGATLQFYQVSNVLNKILVLEDGATLLNNNGTNTFGGPVTLQGSNNFNAGGTWLKFTNALTGPGSLVKIGMTTLFLSTSNGFTGYTSIRSGTLALAGNGSLSGSSNLILSAGAILDVSARADATLTLVTRQTLSGNGTVNGNLLVVNGATLAPGTSIGALTVTNNVTLLGTTFMKLDRTAPTNDVLRGASTINFGGTLSLSFPPGTLVSGDSYKLFSAVNYAGAFANILPTTPGTGLLWDTTQMTTNGILRVVSAPPVIGNISASGSNVIITGSGGAPGTAYNVLINSNLAQPTTAWTRLATNSFDSNGNFSLTNLLDPNSPQRFYRLMLP